MKNGSRVNLGGEGNVRRAFTLVELLVVIAIIGVLIALLLPAVQAAREAARRSQCSNNLKQMGIGIHNFHDTRGGLPPSNYYNRDGVTLWVFLYPFIEQQALWEFFLQDSPFFDMGKLRYHTNFWTHPSGYPVEMKNAMGSISMYRCPTRRGGGVHITPKNDPNGVEGPQIDYAYVFASSADIDIGWWTSGHVHAYSNGVIIGQCLRGPFRRASVQGGDAIVFNSIDNEYQYLVEDPQAPQIRNGNFSLTMTFASIIDGLSNQIFIGDKHIPVGRLGLSEWVDGGWNYSDGSYLQANGWAIVGPMRLFRSSHRNIPICRPDDYGPDDPKIADTNTLERPGFGSWHPMICQFLLGDGSVRSFSVTTPLPILEALSFVDDGVVVQLP